MKQQNSIRILPLSPLLVPGAAAVERACFSLPWSEAGFLSELQKEGVRCFAALSSSGAVVGWAGLESVCGEGSVTNIAVLPKFRRRGTGEALTRALLAAMPVPDPRVERARKAPQFPEEGFPLAGSLVEAAPGHFVLQEGEACL